MSSIPQLALEHVDAELARIADARVIAHIRKLVVRPRLVDRAWDYGNPGESYPTWNVFEDPSSDTAIAYCQLGFGPRSPWGLVGIDGGSIGMDSGWFGSFAEAFFDSSAATDLDIWHVTEQAGIGEPWVFLTPEMSWEATWAQIAKLRAQFPERRFGCDHNIRR